VRGPGGSQRKIRIWKRHRWRRGEEGRGRGRGGTKGKFRVTDKRGVHVSRKTSSLLVIYILHKLRVILLSS
jgi:hypothetical protein